MRRLVLLAASYLLIVIAVPTLSIADDGDLVQAETRFGAWKKVPNRYIVLFKEDAEQPGIDVKNIRTPEEAKTIAQRILQKHGGGRVDHVYDRVFKGFSAELSDARVKELEADPSVAAVFQDEEITIKARALAVDAVPTGINRINAENRTNKGANVEVAVLDTGIDLYHPDLRSNILGGVSCVGGTADDKNGHGTHVAGTIAAPANSIGVVGTAPAAKLWAVRVLDAGGSGTWSSIICGIDWVTKKAATNPRLKVANMSLGGTGSAGTGCDSSPLRKAICKSVNAGVTYVVAAGNESDDVKNHVPAAYPEVIAVSALADSNGLACGGGKTTSYGADDTFATFSNYATQPQDLARLIAAPGVNIYSTWKGSRYNTISGTSMASPHVAGAAALYISKNPTATPAQVKAALFAQAEAGDVNMNGECKSGIVSHKKTTLHPEAVLRADAL